MIIEAPVKFLLVDDLEENLLALDAILRRDGLQLLKARSGPEALELLLRHDIGLAILDVQMPEMDGFELAELMRGTERTRRVPIIFLTAGSIDERRRFRGYESGAVDFLFKPTEPQILKSKAEVFFELYRQRQELLRHQATLRQSEERLRQANAAKDRFLAVLSHELRTPLTPVRMAMTNLEQDQRLPLDVKEDLAMMRRNVDLECRLIDDLLDLSKIVQGKIELQSERMDLNAQIRNAIKTVQADAAAGHLSLSFEAAVSDATVTGDPVRIQQVLWNLLRNAVKFTPSGGAIKVRTFNDRPGHIKAEVSDTGIGIDSNIIDSIFNAFEQGGAHVTRHFGGLGLGLAISRLLVEMHGGKLTASSEGKGRGATFTLELDVAENATSTEMKNSSEAVDRSARIAGHDCPIRILLLEDHEDTGRVMNRLLELAGYQVRRATTIADAIRLLGGEVFDLVISDLGLPDGSGHDFMRQANEHSEITAISLSGFGMQEDIERSKESGFAAHLTKPVSFELLQTTIRRIVHKSDH